MIISLKMGINSYIFHKKDVHYTICQIVSYRTNKYQTNSMYVYRSPAKSFKFRITVLENIFPPTFITQSPTLQGQYPSRTLLLSSFTYISSSKCLCFLFSVSQSHKSICVFFFFFFCFYIQKKKSAQEMVMLGAVQAACSCCTIWPFDDIKRMKLNYVLCKKNQEVMKQTFIQTFLFSSSHIINSPGGKKNN